MEDALINKLLAVYEHLEAKRQRLRREHEEIEATLAGIRKEIAALRVVQPHLFPEVEGPASMTYRNISLRWAILWILSEAVTPQTTTGIADLLRQGGVPERRNFNSIVSAILSQMASKTEIQREGNGYKLTDTGRSAWEAIRRSERFLNRHLSLDRNGEGENSASASSGLG